MGVRTQVIDGGPPGLDLPLEPTQAEPEAQVWEPQLAESLYDLLHSVDLESSALEAGLRKLRDRYGDAVYAELIHLLCHLRFESVEAKRHWQQVRSHRDRLQACQGSSVDLRVALVSYFIQVNRKLQNPMIIEMKLFEQTRASAYRDELTGLYNYRLFREYLHQEMLRSERCGSPLSLVMVDVDDFKRFNDKNGHEAGNETLAAVAGTLKAMLHKVGLPARYGGEEFALILPLTSKTNARALAERTREAIERQPFSHEETQPGGRLTISLGVATYPADATEVAELIRCADRAMYVAKAHGKNQVQLYGQSRRSHSRVEAALHGSFRVLAGESHPVTTRNISEGGMLLLVDEPPAVGSLIEFDLTLAGTDDKKIRAAGRVVHVDPREHGLHPTAIRLVEISNADRMLLMESVRGTDTGSSEVR